MRDAQRRVATGDPVKATLSDKVRFLSNPGSYPHRPDSVQVVETHMSWVFLAGDRAYKFKKPMALEFLDHRSLAARHRNCQVEYRDNLALAPDTYLGVVALRQAPDGALSLEKAGVPVEWLVVMKRLDRDLTLEAFLKRGQPPRGAIEAIARLLIAHYDRSRVDAQAGAVYLTHLATECALNRRILEPDRFGLDRASTLWALDALDRRFSSARPEIEARIGAGLIVDGHGDLRPEHIWLGDRLQIFDRLEFDPRMRVIDPFDEFNYLGLECAIARAPWVRPALLTLLERHWSHAPSPALMEFYTTFRLVLRARICLAHLLDPEPMTPELWPSQARGYLACIPSGHRPACAASCA